jgi:hypothetical protein
MPFARSTSRSSAASILASRSMVTTLFERIVGSSTNGDAHGRDSAHA